jgi:hypothetical protein
MFCNHQGANNAEGSYVAACHRHFVEGFPINLSVIATDEWAGGRISSLAPVGEPIAPLGSGQNLRFSSDGRRSTTESQDGFSRIFDVRTAQALAEPMDHGAARPSAGYFSPDGLFLRTETAADFRIWPVPPALPDATPLEWLLELATACAGKVVNNQGQLTVAPDVSIQIATLRQQIDALPANAPLAKWGRWILNERASCALPQKKIPICLSSHASLASAPNP